LGNFELEEEDVLDADFYDPENEKVEPIQGEEDTKEKSSVGNQCFFFQQE
jgi:hypothetical protein